VIPTFTPTVYDAIVQKAKPPSLLSQLFGAVVVNAVTPRSGSAVVVDSMSAPSLPRPSSSVLPAILLGGLGLLAIVLVVGGRRRG
jgi:hypothetical protein